MIFWPHNDDLSKPPEVEDLRYRRPVGEPYWESPASNKETALSGFWERWKSETGREFPRPKPRAVRDKRIIINRVSHSNRPAHMAEKNRQDRETS